MAQGFDREEADRRRRAWEAESLAAFPFEHVVAPSERALAEWERLRSPTVAQFIAGAPEDLPAIARTFHPDYFDHQGGPPVLEDALRRADALTAAFPDGLKRRHLDQAARFEAQARTDPNLRAAYDLMLREHGAAAVAPEAWLAGPLGDWPAEPPPAERRYAPPSDRKTGLPVPEVAIVLVPTTDPTTIPAHLRWGDWNANPEAEHHVAALRSWRDRFGAELVALSHDLLELRVARRPADRDAAIALAYEQYWYCSDIVSQGFQDLSRLAAHLTVSDWWAFWWD